MKDAFGVSKGVPAAARAAARASNTRKGGTLDGLLYAVPRVNAHNMGRQAARLHRQAIEAERAAKGEYVRAARWGRAKKWGELKVREGVKVRLGAISRTEAADRLAANDSDNTAIQTYMFKKKRKAAIQSTENPLDAYR